MSTSKKVIPLTPVDIEQLKEEATIASQFNFAEILRESPWLGKPLTTALQNLMQEEVSLERKHFKFRAMADMIAEAVSPHSVCSQGCSHCCRIAVPMSEVEAQAIGKSIGRAPAEGVGVMPSADIFDETDHWMGVPCPFLVGSSCSIYAERPIACRLHFSIGAAPTLCDTSLPPTETLVPNISMDNFWQAYAHAMLTRPFADIRDYFKN